MFNSVISGIKTAILVIISSAASVLQPNNQPVQSDPSPSPEIIIATSSAIIDPSPSPYPPKVTEPEAVAATNAAVMKDISKEAREKAQKMKEERDQDVKQGKEPEHSLKDIIDTLQKGVVN